MQSKTSTKHIISSFYVKVGMDYKHCLVQSNTMETNKF